MKAVNDDIDRNERDMKQGQEEIEQWWENVTWRAAEIEVPPHMDIYAPPADNECWQKVQRVVDALNEFGEDPSGDMTEWREKEITRRREGAEQLDSALEAWKQKVLDELHDQSHMEMNLWDQDFNMGMDDMEGEYVQGGEMDQDFNMGMDDMEGQYVQGGEMDQDFNMGWGLNLF